MAYEKESGFFTSVEKVNEESTGKNTREIKGVHGDKKDLSNWELIEEEIYLEALSSSMGQRRLVDSWDSLISGGNWGKSEVGSLIVRRMLQGVIKVLKGDFEKKKGGRNDAMKGVARIIEGREELIGHIAVKHVISAAMSGEIAFNVLAKKVGDEIYTEYRLRKIREHDVKLMENVKSFMDKHHEMPRKKKILRDFIKNKGIADALVTLGGDELKNRQIHYMGAWAIRCALVGMKDEKNGYFVETKLKQIGRKTPNIFVFSSWGMKLIGDLEERIMEVANIVFPMVCTPNLLREDNVNNYGYLSNFAERARFMKTYNKEHLRSLQGAQFPLVIKGVNAVMKTGWRVNEGMLPLVKMLGDSNQKIACIPRCTLELEELKKPAYADKIQNEVEFKKWKALKTAAADRDVKLRSERATFNLKIYIAELMAQYSSFHYVLELDTRGRGYPLSVLNYQGDDLCRSLLQFSEGKPLGDKGFFWLSIHLANLIGDDPRTGMNVDKLGLQDRYQWVIDNAGYLVEVRNHCEFLELWDEEEGYIAMTDKPLQFTAVLMEWVEAYKLTEEERKSFLSHTPIALDASCSGLQVYSALLRDRATASLVNLVPNDKPNDIYSRVAYRVNKDIKDYIEEHGLYSIEDVERVQRSTLRATCERKGLKYHEKLNWILRRKENPKDVEYKDEVDKELYNDWRTPMSYFGLNSKEIKRSHVKNPVMTIFYSSKEFGYAEWIREKIFLKEYRELSEYVRTVEGKHLNEMDISERLRCGIDFIFEGVGSNAANLLASLITKAVKEEVKKPYLLMQWFIDMGEALVNSGKKASWITPLGLPVLQDYSMYKQDKIDNILVGDRVQLSFKEFEERPDKKKQKNAISPNIIHSLDSSFLWYTVCNAIDQGINSFSVIHDSFATHAGDTEDFAKIIRESFVSFFSHDHLTSLRNTFLSRLNKKERKRLEDEGKLDLPELGDFDLNEIVNAIHAFS